MKIVKYLLCAAGILVFTGSRCDEDLHQELRTATQDLKQEAQSLWVTDSTDSTVPMTLVPAGYEITVCTGDAPFTRKIAICRELPTSFGTGIAYTVGKDNFVYIPNANESIRISPVHP